MQAKVLVAWILLVASASQAHPVAIGDSNRVTTVEINALVDRIIEEVNKLIVNNNLDPYHLPDLVEGFDWEGPIGVNWHGEASLRNGLMQGTTSLERNGDALFTVNNLDLSVSAELILREIIVDYDFEATFMDLGPTGHARVTAKDIRFSFNFAFDLGTGAAALNSFDIGQVGNIHVNISGLGLVASFLVDVFINMFIDIFQRVILNILEGVLENVIKDALANISLGVLMMI